MASQESILTDLVNPNMSAEDSAKLQLDIANDFETNYVALHMGDKPADNQKVKDSFRLQFADGYIAGPKGELYPEAPLLLDQETRQLEEEASQWLVDNME
ncbi:hypothetical protein [Eremococcus coleocola]|nr:hypothetical protein [Eremococcus coleocola]